MALGPEFADAEIDGAALAGEQLLTQVSYPTSGGSCGVVENDAAAQLVPVLTLETFRTPMIEGKRAACFICSQCEPAVTAAYSPEACLILPVCGHGGYHPDCLQQWFAHKENCPVCRSEPVGNIFQAIQADDLPATRFFLSVGFNVSTLYPPAGGTCLHLAAAAGAVKVIPLLIRAFEGQGLAVDHPDSVGRTALGYAIHAGHRGTVQILLEAGADPFWSDQMGKKMYEYAHQDAMIMLLTPFLLYPEGEAGASSDEEEYGIVIDSSTDAEND